MRCPTCGEDNPPDARFCANCAVPLSAGHDQGQVSGRCSSCGTENPSDAAFYGSCGVRMGPQPGTGDDPGGAVAQRPGLSASPLIPRDLGELLSETFRVYGASFRAFYTIALIAQIPLAIGQILLESGSTAAIVIGVLFLLPGIVLSILAVGATSFAVATHYLGGQVRVGTCYGRASGSVLSLVGTTILFFVAVAISALLSIILIGIPLLLYLLVSWYFFAQVIMIEGTAGPREAVGRSGRLVRGTWWRVFGLGIVFVIVAGILGSMSSIPGAIASIFSSEAETVLNAIFLSAVLPMGYIGATLVYLDLRVRKEAYTLETMASEVGM